MNPDRSTDEPPDRSGRDGGGFWEERRRLDALVQRFLDDANERHGRAQLVSNSVMSAIFFAVGLAVAAWVAFAYAMGYPPMGGHDDGRVQGVYSMVVIMVICGTPGAIYLDRALTA